MGDHPRHKEIIPTFLIIPYLCVPSPPVEGKGEDNNPMKDLPPSIDLLLSMAVKHHASDLLIVEGVNPTARISGKLVSIINHKLSSADTRLLAAEIADDKIMSEFEARKAIDFCFERPGIGRFRCDLHLQRGSVAIAIRIFPKELPSLEQLHLPPVLRKFCEMSKGLVLLTGPTGCGKSTTLAALVDIINRERNVHIITIEDPIEYLHENKNCIVEQIEVGKDTTSFSSALRHALRQDPNVILVGEMRDLETISIALTAAETGHLIFSTLHTSDAAQTVDRIIDVFPENQQSQIRHQLALSLAGIVSQHLIPALDGAGRIPAVEILIANDAIRNLIRQGKNYQTYSHIVMGRKEGMVTLEESLAQLYKEKKISYEDALFRSVYKEEFEKSLK